MAKEQTPEELKERGIDDIKRLDLAFTQLLRDSSKANNGENREVEMNKILNQYTELINQDAYNFNKTKSISQSSYSYMANLLVGKPLTDTERKNPKKMAQHDAESRARLEDLFTNGETYISAY